jgi:hypothetical protein
MTGIELRHSLLSRSDTPQVFKLLITVLEWVYEFRMLFKHRLKPRPLRFGDSVGHDESGCRLSNLLMRPICVRQYCELEFWNGGLS